MTLESDNENEFLVHISVGHVIYFIRGPLHCLYYSDAGKIHMYKLKISFSFLNTVFDNKNIFKNREVRKETNAVMLNRKTNQTA